MLLLLLLTRVCYQMLRCKQTLYLCIGCLWLLLTATAAAPTAAAAADTAYFTLSIAEHPTCVKPGTPGVFLARVRGEKNSSVAGPRQIPPAWTVPELAVLLGGTCEEGIAVSLATRLHGFSVVEGVFRYGQPRLLFSR